jgi:hypothetical protein
LPERPIEPIAHAREPHVVVAGDTLSIVAEKAYGRWAFWPVIFTANGDQLQDPDRLVVGTSLTVPQLDGSLTSPRDCTLVSTAFASVARYYEGRSEVLASHYRIGAQSYAAKCPP